MPSVCFYFQVHQPFRIKRYSGLHAADDHDYFDTERNAAIVRKVADKCYLPTNRLILDLVRRHEGRFRVSYSLSGVAIEQMRLYVPEALESFVDLAKTGCVEFLGETYYHSLSAVYDQAEFRAQVSKHGELVEQLFGRRPTVFRNTELIYSDMIGQLVSQLGYRAVLAEGADDILGWRSPNFVYRVPGSTTRLLLKNYRLSDDVAFRFSNQGWECFPLSADRYARWIHAISGSGDTVNLFMDYETFGEHQWASTGIFEFLAHLPSEVLRHPDWGFHTPSEVVAKYEPVAEMPFHRLTSWADLERDLTAWQGNRMQQSALRRIYDMHNAVMAKADPQVTDIWRKLQTSDQFYYMCTKWFSDGDVHAYFSPYESPYEAFVFFMNALRDFDQHYLGGSQQWVGNQM